MTTKTKCPICETYDNSQTIYTSNIDLESFSVQVFSARRLPDRRHYQWVRCLTCSLLRSDPILDIDLEKLYVDSKFDYSSEIDGLKKTYLKILKKALDKENFIHSLFEVGGGNGFFLEAAKDYGYEVVVGIEPSKDAIDAARLDIRPNLIPSIMRSNLLPSHSFEVGVMFHTLDHLPDPVQTLKNCSEALISGGVFVVAIHNERSWSAKLLRNRSPIIDVEHTHLYSRKTAEMLFAKIGFQKIRSGKYMNNYSLAYLLHLLPISRKLKKFILASILGKILAKIRLNVSLGNIWVSGTKQ
jgi:SAM-dependent methyltransferase